MKFLHFALGLSLLLAACTSTQTVTHIPANSTLEFDLPAYAMYEASLRNSISQEISVAVIDKNSGAQVRGFGLGKSASAEVMVEENSKLTLRNDSDKPAKVKIQATPKDPASMARPESEVYVSFTLHNTSAQSIPLLIPTVMNPNLSPFSKSGVDLKIGQKILFRENGKKHVLLVVDDKIAPGATINVPKLLKERREVLGLAQN